MTYNDQASSPRIQRGLIILVLFIGTVLFASYAVRSGRPALMAAIPALPLLAYGMSRPKILMIAVLISYYGRLRLPGMPASLMLSHVLQLVMIAVGLGGLSIQKDIRNKIGPPEFFLLLFTAVIILHMYVRGVSFALFRGTGVGGAGYVYILIPILFCALSTRVDLEARDVRRLFWLLAIAASLPFFVQISYVQTGGRTYFLNKFIRAGLGDVGAVIEENLEGARLSSASYLGSVLVMIGLVRPTKNRFFSLLLIATGIFVTSLSGYRNYIFREGAIVAFWFWIRSRHRWSIVITGAVVGLVVFAALYGIMPFLPVHSQRALAFIPFLPVTQEAAYMAEASINWRLELWKISTPHIPEFFWIGRGLATDVFAEGVAYQRSGFYGTREFYYIMHNYHSGFLSFILDFGILGFITGTGALVSMAIAGWRGLKLCLGREDLLSRFTAYSSIVVIYWSFSYFFIYGSVSGSLPVSILYYTLMRILLKVVERRVLDEQPRAPTVPARPAQAVILAQT